MGNVFHEEPMPKDARFVNDLSLAAPVPYGTKAAYAQALTGKRKAEGGILPDDNVRIYVPIDVNGDFLLWRLRSLCESLGFPDEENEGAYREGVGQLISLLRVYDAAQAEIEKVCGHSRAAIHVAMEMVRCLEAQEGTAECFPYEEIETLRSEFGMDGAVRFNAETEAAMEEAREISAGKISAKRYHSVEEFLEEP